MKKRLFLFKKKLIKRKNIIAGFLLYKLFERKTLVFILCSARSGSTLLKALLAENERVSNIPEYNFFPFTNPFEVYYHAYHLSPKQVVVMKQPFFYNQNKEILQWRPPALEDVKLIVLMRNPHDTIESIKQMPNPRKEKFTDKDFVQYWCCTYQCILDKIWDIQEARIVRYEDLVARPIEVTRQLFLFLGFVGASGVEQYKKPTDYDWQWGKDDGGETIQALRVQNKPKAINEDLQRVIEDTDQVTDVEKRLKFYTHIDLNIN
jgi:hypothetical protein